MKNDNIIYVIIFLLSLIVRISFIFLSDYPKKALEFYDAPSWNGVALNLLDKKGFLEPSGEPTSVRPPVYPLFLATIYSIFGVNYKVVYIIQSVLSSLTNVILFLLFRKINYKVALISSFISIFWPPFVVYSSIICSETLYTFLLLLFILLLLKSNTYKSFVALGVLLGAINLTRSTITFYTIFLIFYYIILKIDYKKILKIILMTVVSFVVVFPWTLRNWYAFNRFLLINTAAGELFWSGTYMEWDGICKHNRDENFFKRFGNIKNPVDRDRELFKEGIRNILKNPRGFLVLSVKKFFRFWFMPIGYEILKTQYLILAKLFLVIYCVLVLLCWVFLISIVKDEFLSPIFVLIIYFTVMHNLLAPIPRYRFPIEHVILSFAVSGFFNVIEFIKKLRK